MSEGMVPERLWFPIWMEETRPPEQVTMRQSHGEVDGDQPRDWSAPRLRESACIAATSPGSVCAVESRTSSVESSTERRSPAKFIGQLWLGFPFKAFPPSEELMSIEEEG